VEGVFAGGFAVFGCAERGFSMVNRGGFVVKVWLETAANLVLKNFHFFEIFFLGFSGGSFEDCS
jgi:hypothetical protein